MTNGLANRATPGIMATAMSFQRWLAFSKISYLDAPGNVRSFSRRRSFATVRVAFNAMHPGRPALVVRPTGAVAWQAPDEPPGTTLVAVRGGGHSVAGLSSVDGGLLIDLALMNGVDVEPGNLLCKVPQETLTG